MPVPIIQAIVPSPHIPRKPSPLIVDGFHAASHVGPKEHSPNGTPLVVVLHGNFDRPEWQCEMWSRVAGFYGWILCPRGVPTPWAEQSEDRWTYRGGAIAVAREIEAGTSALKKAYPGAVKTGETILVGFSLGAILAPDLAIASPGAYKYIYLIEGGAEKLDSQRLFRLKRAGIQGIGLAMSTGKNKKAAQLALKNSKKHSLPVVYVDMSGAGHNYRSDFGETGRQSLMELLSLSKADATPAR